MPYDAPPPIRAHIVALPETAGSALYGMVDVLAATGSLWRELTRDKPSPPMIEPRVVSLSKNQFCCGNGIPVTPESAISELPAPEIVIVPELWLSPDDDLADRYGELKEWLRNCRQGGSAIYSACSGAVLLAAAGLLDGCEATSHWGYEDLFRRRFPKVRFNPAPPLVVADQGGRLVTAGGTTSWHDLAIHIIARHCNPGEALRIAKVYLLKWHDEGQLPYASLLRRLPHADAAVRRAEDWLASNYLEDVVVVGAVEASGIPERSLKRRFKAATGQSLIGYAQNLRVEEAKRLLETEEWVADEIAAAVGYENPAFFRRLFKRSTGLTPAAYRRLFRPLMVEEASK